MFGLSLSEIAVIALLILVVFDVEQLPGLMRQAGRMYAKVKGASDDLRRAFNVEVARAEADQRREDLMKRRDEAVKLRNSRPAVPARPLPDDVVMRLSRVDHAPPTADAPSPDAPSPDAAPDATPAAAPDAPPDTPIDRSTSKPDSNDSGGGA